MGGPYQLHVYADSNAYALSYTRRVVRPNTTDDMIRYDEIRSDQDCVAMYEKLSHGLTISTLSPSWMRCRALLTS